MLRTLVCGTLALVVFAGTSLAADKGAKSGKRHHYGIRGVVKTVDTATGALTVAVKTKKAGAKDMTIKIGDKTRVVTFAGSARKVLTGKTSMTGIKTGDKVVVFKKGKGQAAAVIVNPPAHKKPAKKTARK